MPVGTNLYPFSGGIGAVSGWGDRWMVGFVGTWAAGDTWTIRLATTQGNATLGVGNFNNIAPTSVFTYSNRVYAAVGDQFNFSDVGNPTAWEEQAPGAGFVEYLSQHGTQDSVVGFGQLQGRLAVLAKYSVQLWTVNADPSLFSIIQILDNFGTSSPQSIHNLGDYDVLFLDSVGVRSLRSREVTLNAFVDDIGIQIDSILGELIPTVDITAVCSLVEPTTKRYWLGIGRNIYVLSRYPTSKIAAWTQYIPTDQNGGIFTPQWMVTFDLKVYIRTSEGKHIIYGGSTGNLYDSTIATLQTPWLDDKTPKMNKLGQGVDVAIEGGWLIKVGLNPYSGQLDKVYETAQASGDATKVSTFDLMTVAFERHGTHYALRASTLANWPYAATLSEILFHYNKANK